MSLLTTRGLGHRGGLLASSGLGRRLIDEAKRTVSATHDKFNDLQKRIREEDDLLLAVCRSFLKIVCR